MEKNVNPVKRILKCDHSIEESLLVNSAACEKPCVLRTYETGRTSARLMEERGL